MRQQITPKNAGIQDTIMPSEDGMKTGRPVFMKYLILLEIPIS